MSATQTEASGALGVARKAIIVLLLVGLMVMVNGFAVRGGRLDPTALLALGFVILASYTFGQLVERIRLPHITGYLIAGVALGPSAAELLPEAWRWPPFDHGVLNSNVVSQLAPLDTLAVALIAITAGGELKIASLRRGLSGILGVLTGQVVFVVGLSVLFVVAISGGVPQLAMPGFHSVATPVAAALGAVVGTISVATSPAATIAVINDSKASGPFTRNVLATVVLKDVVVVVLFSLASTWAVQMAGLSGADEALGPYLLKHIGGALLLGVLVGLGAALYLRYVKAEVLLFLAFLIYTLAYVAAELDVEPVVLFIAAGFAAANFSSEGDALIETVETLSLPVYVVFFTLAGARLHLAEVAEVAPFALALVAVRALGVYLGVAVGGRATGADPKVQRYGWLGFISQAGVAISLAAIVAERFGQTGQTLSTLIIAAIALNELVGPILLSVGLSLAGEMGRGGRPSLPAAPPEEPEPEASTPLCPWPVPEVVPEAWGPPLRLASAPINEHVRELSSDLSQVLRDAAEEPILALGEQSNTYLRQLRREFLRHHRRITVQASDQKTELNASEALRLEQAELAEKWRVSVLARAASIKGEPGWQPQVVVEGVDRVLDLLPTVVRAPLEDESYRSRPSDGLWLGFGRVRLRARRLLHRAFGAEPPERTVHLRALARYHLWAKLPERLEPVAALYTQAEAHLVARTRSIFDGIVIAYDELASEIENQRLAEAAHAGERDAASRDAGSRDVDATALSRDALVRRLREVRASVNQDLSLALDEVQRISEDLVLRTHHAVGRCVAELKADLAVVGTPDLPSRSRRASRLYRKREEALSWLSAGTRGNRETAAAVYARLALEMELIGLEGRVKDALEEQASSLAKDVRGRAHRQVVRVKESIKDASGRASETLAAGLGPEALADALRRHADDLLRVTGEALAAANKLRDQLSDEQAVSRILDALVRSAQVLTDRYRIPSGPVIRAEHNLPPPVATVEVPFREWVLTRIETSIAPRLLASTRAMAGRVEPLTRALAELEPRIAFNLELAVSELSVLEDQERVPETTQRLMGELILGNLERNGEIFDGYIERSVHWGEDVRDEIRTAVLEGLDELRGNLIDGEVGRLRYQMVRDVGGRRLVRGLTEFRAALSRSLSIVRRALWEAVGEGRLRRFRQLMGLPERAETWVHDDDAFLPPRTIEDIPVVYRRLFSARALEAGDILTGRDQALKRTQEVLAGKSDRAYRAVVLVGPDGVGKSAFVNAVSRSRGWSKIRHLKFDAPATVEDVEAFFSAGGEGQLIIVPGLYWLGSLLPGGFAPLRRFAELAIADRGRNAFLIRSDNVVWEQSTQASQLDASFADVIRLGPLSPDELSAAVLARHMGSGYGLLFTQGAPPKSRLEELALTVTTPLSRPQPAFFRALHAASGGLLRDALRLWIAAVQKVDEGQDIVQLGPIPSTSMHALRRLPPADVLSLYQVVRQGWMSAEVHASLFRVDVAAAQAHLAALRQRGILEVRGSVYRVAHHLRGSVYRVLVERGFVS